MVQDEPDLNFFAETEPRRSEDVLVYDILIFERHLKPSIQLSTNIRAGTVLDHTLPKIDGRTRRGARTFGRWPSGRTSLQEADGDEADWRSGPESLPLRHRLKFRSAAADVRLRLPVMLLACPYAHWW
jgi:hypothetical protein